MREKIALFNADNEKKATEDRFGDFRKDTSGFRRTLVNGIELFNKINMRSTKLMNFMSVVNKKFGFER